MIDRLERLRSDLRETERELRLERQHLGDAERRGRMAEQIEDRETVDVARKFVSRHSERVAVLERKAEALRAEVALVERDLAELAERGDRGDSGVGASSAGMPDEDILLKVQLDRAAREAEAETRLRELKKRMGK